MGQVPQIGSHRPARAQGLTPGSARPAPPPAPRCGCPVAAGSGADTPPDHHSPAHAAPPAGPARWSRSAQSPEGGRVSGSRVRQALHPNPAFWRAQHPRNTCPPWCLPLPALCSLQTTSSSSSPPSSLQTLQSCCRVEVPFLPFWSCPSRRGLGKVHRTRGLLP